MQAFLSEERKLEFKTFLNNTNRNQPIYTFHLHCWAMKSNNRSVLVYKNLNQLDNSTYRNTIRI